VIDFEIAEQPPLKVTQAYLFPNPTRSGGGGSGGRFVVDVPGDSVNTLLRIYTVSGRLVRVLKAFSGIGQVQLDWDGLDEEGHELAGGVYLFKVHANLREEDGSSSAREKASAEGKFVIIKR
jgi:flagellar hook assembly protein FlgD